MILRYNIDMSAAVKRLDAGTLLFVGDSLTDGIELDFDPAPEAALSATLYARMADGTEWHDDGHAVTDAHVMIPIHEALLSAPGLLELTVRVSDGVARVTVLDVVGTVREAVSAAAEELPENVLPTAADWAAIKAWITKANISAGTSKQPVYVSGGVPKACTYKLYATVPEDLAAQLANGQKSNVSEGSATNPVFLWTACRRRPISIMPEARPPEEAQPVPLSWTAMQEVPRSLCFSVAASLRLVRIRLVLMFLLISQRSSQMGRNPIKAQEAQKSCIFFGWRACGVR